MLKTKSFVVSLENGYQAAFDELDRLVNEAGLPHGKESMVQDTIYPELSTSRCASPSELSNWGAVLVRVVSYRGV